MTGWGTKQAGSGAASNAVASGHVTSAEWKREVYAVLPCCLALLVCIAVANPFVNAPFDDDWSYADVALRLAQTGTVHYGGWGSPTILFQSAWAALFIRLFGFSFNVLRAASLPFSAGFVCLTYFLARTLGLRREFAQFAALAVAVSPLFLPLAASFMTEPYACFFGLLCLYAAVRCALSEDPSSAIVWVWVLALAGIAGGSDRQTVWIPPMLVAPYLAWRRRSDQRFLRHFAAAYASCVAALAIVILKFRPVYAASEVSIPEWLQMARQHGGLAVEYIASVALVTALMCLPAFLCAQPLWKRVRLAVVGTVLLISVIAIAFLRQFFGTLGIVPFAGNILTRNGILSLITGPGSRPDMLNGYVRYAFTLVLLHAIAIWIFLALSKSIAIKLPKPVLVIFSLFTIPYLCLLIPGSLLELVFDRYALPLIPLLLICVLASLQDAVPRLPAVAWVCLVAFGLYGTAITHDYARLLQARTVAAAKCTELGIARRNISAGMEQDGWFQLRTAGVIETPRFGGHSTATAKSRWWFWWYATSLHPDYVAVSSTLNEAPKDAIVTVPYTNWAPPSRQVVSVVKAAEIPVPKS